MRCFTLFFMPRPQNLACMSLTALLSSDQPQTGQCPHVMASTGLEHWWLPHVQNVSRDTQPPALPTGLGGDRVRV